MFPQARFQRGSAGAIPLSANSLWIPHSVGFGAHKYLVLRGWMVGRLGALWCCAQGTLLCAMMCDISALPTSQPRQRPPWNQSATTCTPLILE